ncbi:unnamed protein product [Calypogeia fissa]
MLKVNAPEGDTILVGLGRKRGPWMLCAMFLLLVTVILNVDIQREARKNFTPGNILAQYSLKLPSFSSMTAQSSAPHKTWHNLLLEEPYNYTSTLVSLLQVNTTGDNPCNHATTNYTKLGGLPEPLAGNYVFATDILHRLTLVAYEENGTRRCAGGDYFEVDFHNDFYRSRLPTVDFGNGSYGLDLIVPARFAGHFVLEISLLYGNWHGLEVRTDDWAKMTVVMSTELEMVANFGNPNSRTPHNNAPIKQCTLSDFDLTSWQGRWTRSWFNESCGVDEEKRFRCLPEDHYHCEEPWCFGPIGNIDSNGWAYSAHCSFKIFTAEEAWKCLDGRWLLLWGDSNFLDTARNLILFIMDQPLPKGRWLSEYLFFRNYEDVFVNQHQVDQTFQISQIWNGHIQELEIGEGLDTLRHEEHQQRLIDHFNGTKRWPDTIVMNSGMHDGVHFGSTESYIESADWAIDWWVKFYNSIPENRRPQLLWRTTIAPAGIVRRMPSNPNKLETYNHIMVEKLVAVRDVLPIKFIDTFDLTFPFHYNNECSDGGHYGRPPGSNENPWWGYPHWYFVDIMLAHIWLNALCPST